MRQFRYAAACTCSEPQALQNSLTGVLRLCPKLGILPGVVTASPAFLAASRAVQRLAVRREATEACAGGDPEAMAAVLQKAARLGHMSICRRLEVGGLHDYPISKSMQSAVVLSAKMLESILAFWVDCYTGKHQFAELVCTSLELARTGLSPQGHYLFVCSNSTNTPANMAACWP